MLLSSNYGIVKTAMPFFVLSIAFVIAFMLLMISFVQDPASYAGISFAIPLPLLLGL